MASNVRKKHNRPERKKVWGQYKKKSPCSYCLLLQANGSSERALLACAANVVVHARRVFPLALAANIIVPPPFSTLTPPTRHSPALAAISQRLQPPSSSFSQLSVSTTGPSSVFITHQPLSLLHSLDTLVRLQVPVIANNGLHRAISSFNFLFVLF